MAIQVSLMKEIRKPFLTKNTPTASQKIIAQFLLYGARTSIFLAGNDPPNSLCMSNLLFLVSNDGQN